MIISLHDLGKYRNGKLWIGEQPEVNQNIIETIESKLEVEGICTSYEERKVAIELKFPRNTSYYALLGAIHYPSDNSKLSVEVAVSKEYGPKYLSPYVKSPEEVYSGIIREFADSILNAALKHLSNNKSICGGKLIFNIGAYSAIGSSDSIFSLLTTIISFIFEKGAYLLGEEAMKDYIMAQIDR